VRALARAHARAAEFATYRAAIDAGTVTDESKETDYAFVVTSDEVELVDTSSAPPTSS
jgi:hypothetical protein